MLASRNPDNADWSCERISVGISVAGAADADVGASVVLEPAMSANVMTAEMDRRMTFPRSAQSKRIHPPEVRPIPVLP